MRLGKTVAVAACLSPWIFACAQVRATDQAAAAVAASGDAIDGLALEQLVDSVLAARMQAEHVPGAAFVFVHDGRVVLAKGYGFADLEARRPVSADSTIWRIGSITKVFTAAAVLQLAERGLIRLDADVNSYLRRLQVPATFREPVTAAHLLTHTAGFDEIPGVRLAASRSALRPLDEFLRERLVRVRAPGRVTSYSSFGMALAGLLVEDMSGLSYEEYLRRNIFEPLGMARTHVTPGAADEARLATGYEYEDGAHARAPYEWYHTTPAGAINSSATDMARFLLALLDESPGRSRVLAGTTLRAMQERQATMHPLIPGWGYGLQENDLNGQRIFEHGGDIAGFSSLLVLLPEQRAGFFVVSHHEGSNLRFALQRAVLDRFFPEGRDLTPPPPATGSRASVERFVGTYRWNIFCRSCASPQPLPEFVVTANDDGTIGVTGKTWVEVSSLYFRSTDGKEHLGFAADSLGRIVHLTGGSWKVGERVP